MLAENAAYVQALLDQHVGMCFGQDQAHLMASRLDSLARHHNLCGADALVNTLRSAPTRALIDSVIDALTTHETSFFRDPAIYQALSSVVLPGLIERRAPQRSLAIWSAGCSTGEEPYSLAILIRERFPELLHWRLRLAATDVSRPVVERAREGRFTTQQLRRGISNSAQEKYFERDGEQLRACEPLRRMINWEVMNLTATWPAMQAYDLILMRNVLIYFSAESRSRTLARAAAHLAGDGCLVLGTSETTFGASTEFVPSVVHGATIYQKVRK